MHNHLFIGLFFLTTTLHAQSDQELPPPNILWISWEDVGPHLGAYGDDYAQTPHMDRLAEEGITYLNAYSNYPVCAPARATIITGQYASSFGGQHMRSRNIPDERVRMFPVWLREAGYYCTNDYKTDYQLTIDSDFVWDDPSYGSRWDGREEGQPFFSVINLTTTHEGHSRTNNTGWAEQLDRLLPERHDPSQAPVPPYLPDTETTRANIAQYYDNLTYTDSVSGAILKRLEEEGLAENTIVMFWGDHGWGMPRGKRWPYLSGLQVPLIVRVPPRYRKWVFGERGYRPGQQVNELVSFVDFAPTLLSIAGIPVPEYMQGLAFLGPQAQPERTHVYGGRGRMDETYDCIRAVIDGDFLYLRNFMHHLPYAQTIRSMEQQPIMMEWRQLHREGKLNPAQKAFFVEEKPVEELYDLKNDPHQLHNLADERKYRKELENMRKACENWMLEIHDVGLLTEPLHDMMKWPEATWPAAVAPWVARNGRLYWNGDMEMQMKAAPGHELAWKKAGQDRWKLYDQPVVLGPGETLSIMTQRIGFYKGEAQFTAADVVLESNHGDDRSDQAAYPDWNPAYKNSGRLQRLLELKSLDLEPDNALEGYLSHLDDEDAAIRYWSTVGVRAHSESRREKKLALEQYERLLDDPSPLVRIEAATALCQAGKYETAMSVFKKAMQHDQETVRLYALNQLDKMGEKARMAQPFPEIPRGTANHYTHRIILRIYKRLGITPDDLDYPTPVQRREIWGVYNSMILDNLWDYGFE